MRDKATQVSCNVNHAVYVSVVNWLIHGETFPRTVYVYDANSYVLFTRLSRQTPRAWVDERRRGSHKRSASCGSTDQLKEVKQQPILPGGHDSLFKQFRIHSFIHCCSQNFIYCLIMHACSFWHAIRVSYKWNNLNLEYFLCRWKNSYVKKKKL